VAGQGFVLPNEDIAMRAIITLIVVCSSVWSVSAAMAADPQNAKSDLATMAGDRTRASDAWRFKYYQGHWWYWLPAKQWAVYERGRWLMPPDKSAASGHESLSAVVAAAADAREESGSFAEDYPAAPVGLEPENQSAEYYLSTGNVFSRHAHEHAQLLERYASSGETVPASIVREQSKAIHHDVEQAQKSFSRVAAADEETTSENLPDAVKKLQVGLRKVAESVRQLESRVQRQGSVEAALVRGQTAVIDRMLQQANEAATAAEEEQRKYEQNQKDLVGVE
jgi:hypothetical protein